MQKDDVLYWERHLFLLQCDAAGVGIPQGDHGVQHLIGGDPAKRYGVQRGDPLPGEKTQILLYAQDFDYAKHDTTELEITINTSARSVTKQVIDDNHCNPKAEWLKLGKPDLLTPAQVKMIKESTRLVSESQAFTAENGNTTIRLSVQTNDVVLLTLE